MNRMLTSFFLVLFVPLYLPAQTANWTALSPDYFPTNVSGQIHGISRISEMKFHPSDPNKMYAISARGGLFISTNAGASWTIAPGTDKMPSNRLASVCVDFTDDQIIYLGTGDDNYYYSGTGVWKSVNGGNTFTQTPMGNLLVLEMIMDPLDHNTIVAATNAGIYKTSNGGVTWTAKTSTAISFYDLVQNQGPGSRVMYAATYSDFYRSTDFGDTWTQITSGLYVPAGYSDGGGCRIGVSPANPAKVYFYMNSKGGTLFKSSDSGLNFVNIKDSISPYLTGYTNDPSDPGQGNYNTGFCVDRTDSNTVYYVGHVVWKSTNGGQTWSQLTNWWAVLHTDMHQMFVNPYNLSQLWNMNDGGVWLSTNGGSNWTPKSDGIYGYEIYHGYTSPTRKDMVSIGTQDNGELYYSGNTWYCNRGGDWSSKVAFDYFPSSSRAYYYSNARRRYVTGGESTYGLPVSSFMDIAFYPSNPGLAVVGNMEAYRTSNLGSGTPVWTQITSIAKTIKAVHISPADSNRVYIITNDQNLYVSTNAWSGTPVFTNYTLPSATSSTAGIISMKYNPDILYMVCNNKVYKSVNNGATWTNITYNLPSINFMDVLQDEYFSSAELVFVGGGNSVYYKLKNQTSWTLFTTNLPSRSTMTDIMLYNDGTNNSVLRVAEYGRGIWETSFENLRELNADFKADKLTPCPGDTVHFADNSTGSPTGWTWTFQGGSPGTSTAQNPVVVYNSTGIYSVTLTVNNASTSSTISKTGYISTAGRSLPVTENFEGGLFPPAGYTLVDGGNDGIRWELTSAASGYGLGSSCMYFNNYYNNVGGTRDELRTPTLNFSGYTSVKLTFDVAYQPYSLSSYVDSLQVLISTDCGQTFSPVYLKFGAALSTVPGTVSSAFVPTAGQWRTDTINLSSYAGSTGVILSFMNINRYGNQLYLDNINLSGTSINITLNLSAFIEGFYQGSMSMAAVADPSGHPSVCDTITVGLAASTAPYNTIYSKKGLLNTNGTCQVTFPAGFLGNTFYIFIRHRNCLETWSSVPVPFNSGNVYYDFSSDITKAYGNNLVTLSGVFALYSGDVNQDGFIESSDYSEIENGTQSFLFGYVPDDLTGDLLVESSDFNLLENSSQLFLYTLQP